MRQMYYILYHQYIEHVEMQVLFFFLFVCDRLDIARMLIMCEKL